MIARAWYVSTSVNFTINNTFYWYKYETSWRCRNIFQQYSIMFCLGKLGSWLSGVSVLTFGRIQTTAVRVIFIFPLNLTEMSARRRKTIFRNINYDVCSKREMSCGGTVVQRFTVPNNVLYKTLSTTANPVTLILIISPAAVAAAACFHSKTVRFTYRYRWTVCIFSYPSYTLCAQTKRPRV